MYKKLTIMNFKRMPKLRGRMANEYPNCQTSNPNPVELSEECLSLCYV